MSTTGLSDWCYAQCLCHRQSTASARGCSTEATSDEVSVDAAASIGILATIASVAPMLGFLGTVQGMIVAFGDIEANIGQQNIVQAAASGIRVALLTTAFGLIVGIPAYMAFNYFTGLINDFVLQVESSAAELIEVVSLRLTLDKGDS